MFVNNSTCSLLLLSGMVASIILLIGWRRYPPFLVLLGLAWATAFLSGIPLIGILPLIGSGMGSMFGEVAPVIIMGTVLGMILEQSGSALLLANRLICGIGRHAPALSLALAGYIISIPVYCDTGFILLSSIRNTMASKGISHPVTLNTALGGGLYATHAFVPPTPGPAAAAIILGLSPSKVIPYGMVIALCTTLVALAWGKFVIRLPLSSLPAEERVTIQQISQQIDQQTEKNSPEKPAPNIYLAAIPLITPLALMSASSLFFHHSDQGIAAFIGQPANALFIGLLTAIPLLKKGNLPFQNILTDSIKGCANIILIIAAGGALTSVLHETGHISQVTQSLPVGQGILFPFLIACMIKLIQGSNTVALISSATIIEPLLPALGLDTETGRLIAFFSAGAGAMVVAYANDSYFWVIAQFGQMTPATSYKSFTVATLLQGISGLAMVFLLARFLL